MYRRPDLFRRLDLFRHSPRFRGIMDMLSMSHDVRHDGEKTLFSITIQKRCPPDKYCMSKLCIRVSATEPNSKLCKLQSSVDILEVGVPIEKVTNRSDTIYLLIS